MRVEKDHLCFVFEVSGPASGTFGVRARLHVFVVLLNLLKLQEPTIVAP